MRQLLVDTLRRRRVLTRADALGLVPAHVLDDAVRAVAIVAVHPGVYVLPEDRQLRDVRRRAALAHLPDAAISHTDGLDVWRLPTHLDEAVHLTASSARSATRSAQITLHRRTALPAVVTRQGLRVVSLEQTVVESWPLLPPIDRRVPVLVALRERRTTGTRMLRTLEQQPRTAGAEEMRRVFALAAAGCHSPLELWGHEHVFSDPRLPGSQCQVPVDLALGRIYLDRLYVEEMVDVELDGAAYHGSPGQRERDLRRDAALAALGFVTIRYSHPRLHDDPDSVVRELLAVLARRRAQLGLGAA
jgi:very-short-patch-repair endonuclease